MFFSYIYVVLFKKNKIEVSIDRPVSSRLSKFLSPLPPILNKPDSKNKYNSTSPGENRGTDKDGSLNSTMKNLNVNDDTVKNAVISSESNILIAIRLPNGDTIKNNFSKSDLILKIIKHASEASNIDFMSQDISLLEMPKNIINDLNRTIESYGLKNRTMLHIVQRSILN